MTRLLLVLLMAAVQTADLTPRPWDGYRGIWYMNQPTGDAHR